MIGLDVTYLGQCGFLLDFGDTRIVTDPHLSDNLGAHANENTPWRRLYPPPAELAGLRPDGILISHSHGDHLDPLTLKPYFENGGACAAAAPAPECERLQRLGAPDIIFARAEESFYIGSVLITPIPCAHTQLHTNEEGRFLELSYILSRGDIRVFFGGDMSLYDGLYKRLREAAPSLMLLPVNGTDAQRTEKGIIGNISSDQAAALAAALNAPYVPMHHDLYIINGCEPGEILRSAFAAGAKVHLLKPMQTLRLNQAGAVIPV